MKFATRPNLGLNRPPAIWFIRRFLDPHAEILLLPAETILEDAPKMGAVPFHVPGCELHVDKSIRRTTLDAFLGKYGYRGRDPALDAVAAIVRDASFGVPAGQVDHPEAYGIRMLNQGFRLTTPDDRVRMDRMCELYDALYQACAKRIADAAAAPAAV